MKEFRNTSDYALAEAICTTKDQDERAPLLDEWLRRAAADPTRAQPFVQYGSTLARFPLPLRPPGRPRHDYLLLDHGVMFDVPSRPYSVDMRWTWGRRAEGKATYNYCRFVRVVNSTPEPGGWHKIYYLKVPPYIENPVRAIAWTFGYTPHGYTPTQET